MCTHTYVALFNSIENTDKIEKKKEKNEKKIKRDQADRLPRKKEKIKNKEKIKKKGTCAHMLSLAASTFQPPLRPVPTCRISIF